MKASVEVGVKASVEAGVEAGTGESAEREDEGGVSRDHGRAREGWQGAEGGRDALRAQPCRQESSQIGGKHAIEERKRRGRREKRQQHHPSRDAERPEGRGLAGRDPSAEGSKVERDERGGVGAEEHCR